MILYYISYSNFNPPEKENSTFLRVYFFDCLPKAIVKRENILTECLSNQDCIYRGEINTIEYSTKSELCLRLNELNMREVDFYTGDE